jgi:hypothetical protein
MATIQYTTYRFNRPPLLSSDDFEILKEILTEKPDYNINPPSSFVETFKGEIIYLSIGAAGFLIAKLNIAEWLNLVGGIFAFLAFFSLLSFVPSMLSYFEFYSNKSKYYSKLMRDIIKSNNYTEFINIS